MILLVDSHALLWALSDDPGLRSQAREAIASPANEVLVSAAVVWELAIKRALGKLHTPDDLVATIEATRFVSLPITLLDGEAAAALPRHHGDPFDRMLVAQAQRLGAVIVTRDPAFAAYDVEVLPA
jgi:PIN domain nuclease of toxin-antitoxin system